MFWIIVVQNENKNVRSYQNTVQYLLRQMAKNKILTLLCY